MVKKNTTNSINQNFEALKAQMQAKRRLAENKFEAISKEEPTNEEEKVTNIREINSNDEELDEYITLNIIDDEEDDKPSESIVENNNLKEEIEENQYEDSDCEEMEEILIDKNDKKAVVSDLNINKIVIRKVEKQEAPKRITYYLKPETIKKIDKFSKAAGMGKSEFVQTILDEILNNLEIEK
ncbi:hypothetical protein [Clostridium mediterraneense]|uniref:hypothetical protein n=1 Tax=Clostridium mediterraneense TaxID=1805472 RepID=UPI000A033477|nr:hypothetical protein [Clostridium mediterraneense]